MMINDNHYGGIKGASRGAQEVPGGPKGSRAASGVSQGVNGDI